MNRVLFLLILIVMLGKFILHDNNLKAYAACNDYTCTYICNLITEGEYSWYLTGANCPNSCTCSDPPDGCTEATVGTEITVQCTNESTNDNLVPIK